MKANARKAKHNPSFLPSSRCHITSNINIVVHLVAIQKMQAMVHEGSFPIGYGLEQVFLVDNVRYSIIAPLSHRFLAMTLRLAFTKRRFEKVLESYKHQATETDDHLLQDLLFTRVLERSFGALRREIARIERGHECMKRTALPCVRTQMGLYQSYLTWLSGFRETTVRDYSDNDDDDIGHKGSVQQFCCIPMLSIGDETTTAIKSLIAQFVGVPTGRLLHDLRNLQGLLEQPADSPES